MRLSKFQFSKATFPEENLSEGGPTRLFSSTSTVQGGRNDGLVIGSYGVLHPPDRDPWDMNPNPEKGTLFDERYKGASGSRANIYSSKHEDPELREVSTEHTLNLLNAIDNESIKIYGGWPRTIKSGDLPEDTFHRDHTKHIDPLLEHSTPLDWEKEGDEAGDRRARLMGVTSGEVPHLDSCGPKDHALCSCHKSVHPNQSTLF